MASALERAIEAVANTASDDPKEDNFEAVARAVLMAVRDLPDEFVMSAEYLMLGDQDSFAACIDAILNEKDTTND